MVRLFSYRRGRTISVEELLDGTRPGFHSYASMYSFSKERHGYGLRGWADPRFGRAELRLKDGMFSAAITYSSIALLVCLGDVSLDEVSVNSSAIAPLDNLNPPFDFYEAQDLRKRFAVGFRLNHLLYRSSLPAAVNATYALRSTANRRADLLITFRVVREHGDNSLTILWKKLRTYPKPSWQASPDRQDE
jgi:hypothetical protein